KIFIRLIVQFKNICSKWGATDWHIFNDIIELFELAVVDGRSPAEVLGDDVATFADELLSDNKEDWRNKYRQALNDYFAQK
ncbi:MAG: DUF1048 domain-containing protein, partial [Lactococcus lactis]|nr:DUF1048 domain-containing protein [Lactococcus lactis]